MNFFNFLLLNKSISLRVFEYLSEDRQILNGVWSPGTHHQFRQIQQIHKMEYYRVNIQEFGVQDFKLAFTEKFIL